MPHRYKTEEPCAGTRCAVCIPGGHKGPARPERDIASAVCRGRHCLGWRQMVPHRMALNPRHYYPERPAVRIGGGW